MWSGRLGPKRREGDLQAPEGFYTIAQDQMKPDSQYYLAFNLGYPNAYDRAHGRTGDVTPSEATRSSCSATRPRNPLPEHSAHPFGR